MAEKKSEASPYASRFGGGYISAGQYIAENMVDRIARSKGKSLPHKFWNLPAWKRTFLLQLRHANSMLKVYETEALIRALRTKEGKKVYSLAAPWLDALVQEAARELATLNALKVKAMKQEAEAPREPASEKAEPEQPRPAFVAKPTPLGKLRDLD